MNTSRPTAVKIFLPWLWCQASCVCTLRLCLLCASFSESFLLRSGRPSSACSAFAVARPLPCQATRPCHLTILHFAKGNRKLLCQELPRPSPVKQHDTSLAPPLGCRCSRPTSRISSPSCDRRTTPTRAPGSTFYGQRRSHKELQAPVPIKEQSERVSDSTGAVGPELSCKTCGI